MQIQITGGVALIDDLDQGLIMGHSWHTNDHGYAISRIGGKLVRMHRLITGAKEGEHVDHKNRNTLDNRRKNLRVGLRNHNMWNSIKKDRGGKRKTSSKFKGVNRSNGRWPGWHAEVWKFGKKIFTKRFPSEVDAAIGYNIVAKREFGEYALLNSVDASASDKRRVALIVNSFQPKGPKGDKKGCVTFSKAWGRWTYRTIVDGKMKTIGGYKSREEAEEVRTKYSNLTGGESQP